MHLMLLHYASYYQLAASHAIYIYEFRFQRIIIIGQFRAFVENLWAFALNEILRFIILSVYRQGV